MLPVPEEENEAQGCLQKRCPSRTLGCVSAPHSLLGCWRSSSGHTPWERLCVVEKLLPGPTRARHSRQTPRRRRDIHLILYLGKKQI